MSILKGGAVMILNISLEPSDTLKFSVCILSLWIMLKFITLVQDLGCYNNNAVLIARLELKRKIDLIFIS